MERVVCTECGQEIPLTKYCIFCGKSISEIRVCWRCQSQVLQLMKFCTNCGIKLDQSQYYRELLTPSTWDKILATFRTGILVVFLLSIYFFVQILLGTLLFSFLPGDLAIESPSSVSILIITLILSNLIMVLFITRVSPSTFESSVSEKLNLRIIFFLLLLLFILIFFLEIMIIALNYLLDVIGLSSEQISPYDSFFEDPINYFLFALLAVSIGPVFEELVFRQVLINSLGKQVTSKTTLVLVSAIIFALSHSAGDLLDGSLRYAILHLVATTILGVILGVLFIYKGLKAAIIFHSLWNLFSVFVQLFIIIDQSLILDAILTISFFFSIIITLWLIYSNRNEIKGKITEINRPHQKEGGVALANLCMIVLYELILPLSLYNEPNFSALLIVFIFQLLGVILGVILIEGEKKQRKIEKLQTPYE